MDTTLIAGSYERFLFGFQYKDAAGEDQAATLKRSFTYASHKGPVKCVARFGAVVASGGSDDLVHLYDLKAGGGKDLGCLMNPCDGAVTALALHAPPGRSAPSHLLTGSQDGGVTVWKAGAWQALKTMRGHTKEVHGVAAHPSGAVALSVGHDSTLRLWNLVSGKCGYTTKLEHEAHGVAFDATGDRYALLCGPLLSVHGVDTAASGGAVATLRVPCRALCMAWQGEHGLLAGSDDGSLRLFDVRQPGDTPAWCVDKAHKVRVKGVCLAHVAPGAPLPPHGSAIGTCSNDGLVKVWDARMLAEAGSSTPTPLGEASTGARFTCLAGGAPPSAAAAPSARQQQQGAAQPPRHRGAAEAAPRAQGQRAGDGRRQQEGKQGPGGSGGGSSSGAAKRQLQATKAGAKKARTAAQQQHAISAAAAAEAAQRGVVVRGSGGGGVGDVEFPDDPRESQQQKKKQKQKQKQKKSKQQQRGGGGGSGGRGRGGAMY